MKTTFLYILFFLCCASTKAQDEHLYNINNKNGLSTNHVYCTLVDRHGYLWISTDDGVYRYNGYTFRKYDYNDGLPNVDIWNMHEDSKGRIWLLTIAQGTGYIKNNVYKPLYQFAHEKNSTIYPSNITEHGDTVAIMNLTYPIGARSINIVINDTVRRRTFFTSELKKGKDSSLTEYCITIDGEHIIEINRKTTTLYNLRELLRSIKTPPVIKTITGTMDMSTITSGASVRSYNHTYIIYWWVQKNELITLNYHNNKVKKILLYDSLKNPEAMVNIYDNAGKLYLLTNASVYQADSLLNITRIYDYNSTFRALTTDGKKIVYYLEDDTWGKLISTGDNGVYIDSRQNAGYRRPADNMDNYRFISNCIDSAGYWWNGQTHTLAYMTPGRTLSTNRLSFTSVKFIIPYDHEKSVILESSGMQWLYKDGSYKPFLSGVKHVVYDGKGLSVEDDYSYLAPVGRRIQMIDSNRCYFLGTGSKGALYIEKKDTVAYITTLDYNRYQGMLYSKKNNLLLLYTNDKLLVLNDKHKIISTLYLADLNTLNIQRIEKILEDRYGNIWIKDYDKLYVCNMQCMTLRRVFSNYNLEKAIVDIQNHALNIAGLFGVLRAEITPYGYPVARQFFPNTRTLYYNQVNEAQFSKNEVLLKTDNGSYFIQTNNVNSAANQVSYRINFYYKDSIIDFSSGDTLSIDQLTTSFNIDVINPVGTGKLNIRYYFDGSTKISSGNQLVLPRLEPGTYNKIVITASDDAWKSKPNYLYVYIQPYWWQEPAARKIIYALAIILLGGVGYVIFLITRKIVNRNNERRTHRRELELKSIYSQINPHFIFNSLSTAQYFVKKNRNKEAYEHINQFSDLLRSYIKSSRNKYITIADELENLENYLELQLTRFEDKFEYQFQIDEHINIEKVKIPSLILQPIVENALNHGLFHKEGLGHLHISFEINTDEDVLICKVDDDGIGRAKSRELRNDTIRKADSYGTILIEELINTFNKYEKITIGLEYIDKQLPETGTIAMITIKNYHYAG